MRSLPVMSRLMGAMALLLAMLATVVAAPTAAGQTGNSSIEIHNRVCPVEYEGQNFFEDCHDTIPDPGLPFTFSNGVTREGTTNEEGNVGFANLPAGTYTIIGGAPAEFADLVAYCSVGTAEVSDQEQIPVEYVNGGIQFDLPEDTNVICDWYNIPYDLQGEQPDTFDLPIYKLLCAEYPGDMAASDFVMGGVLPAGCEQYGGVTVTIADEGGEVLGSCVTEATQPCYVNVPIGATVYATEDLTTVPAGYAPVNGETIVQEIPPASEAWILFVNVEVATPEPTPEPTPTQPVEPEPTLPPAEPGRMLQIHEGMCDPDQPGTLAFELTDLRGTDAVDARFPDVVIAESSSSSVPVALDELLQGEYAIVAYSDDDDPTPVACTEIADALNDNNELVLGLRELDDSDHVGIAFLVDADDGSQTNISVFLAEGLEEEATPTANP